MKLLFHSTFMSRFKFEFQSPRGTNVYVDRLTRMRTYYPAVLDRASHMRKDPVILCNFPDNSFHYGVVREVAGGISQCFKTCRARKSYVASSSTVWNDCSDVFPRRASVSQRHTSRFTLHTSRFTLPQQLLS